MHPKPLELLAPARDADIGIAAIDHGADAVYIGGPAFGARAAAANRIEDIARLVDHAHRFHARVFVALNTILADDELEPAREQIESLHAAGVDALIVQDMGLLMLDLPPIELHASTQCDIRTPAKARFLADVGFSQLVLARELDLTQIAAIRAALPDETVLEYFVHGALCVAYSGQCYISHAQTGRSANRGECSQACRLPYEVRDLDGRILAHDKHVLSMKDNNQSDNLEALVEAGVSSFKIEGRYKDLGYVKNITAHYRTRLDALISQRPGLKRSSSGETRFHFTPDPNQNFNRAFTDYFTHGRRDDIGAFDSPKNPGLPIGCVTTTDAQAFELETDSPETQLHNGDGLCYFTLQRELVGFAVNRVEQQAPGRWRVFPKDPVAHYPDLRAGTVVNRNRDMAWVRMMDKPTSERWIEVTLTLSETATGYRLTVLDADGHRGEATLDGAHEPARSADGAYEALRGALGRLGGTVFRAGTIQIELSPPPFIPASRLNALRREAIAALEAAREAARPRPLRKAAVEPPAVYPEAHLSYRANVANHKARDFYLRHGVRYVAPAYEANEETGDVSLMITKHCVRYALSLCPKQTRGVIGVKGTIRADPLVLVNGREKLTLRFDCKPCEMHVMGTLKPAVRRAETPVRFYRTRPDAPEHA